MSEKMSYEDVRRNAILVKGVDQYYEELRLLKEDLQFFSMYIYRNKKSAYGFQLIPVQMCGYAFHDIYRRYGFSDSYIEEVFAIFTLMKAIVFDVYNNICNDEERHIYDDIIIMFNEYLKDELELDLRNYVHSFVGSSSGTTATRKQISEILNAEKKEDAIAAWERRPSNDDKR